MSRIDARISDWIGELSQGDQYLGELLAYSVGRLLKDAASIGRDWEQEIKDSSKINTILDFYKIAITIEDEWLRDVDDHGRPKLLMRFDNLNEIEHGAKSKYLSGYAFALLLKRLHNEDFDIEKLPYGIRVLSDLDLSKSVMPFLPGGLCVNGDLQLHQSAFISLPVGLEVQGDLNLSNSIIREIPGDLKVEGYLNLRFSKVQSIHKDAHLGGALDLEGTSITELPEGLCIGGELMLYDTQIKALPNGLKIGSDLYLYGSKLECLPYDISVLGDIYLRGSNIIDIPPSISDEAIFHTDDGKMTAAEFRGRIQSEERTFYC